MLRTRHVFLAGIALLAFVSPAAVSIASADPMMRLAQAAPVDPNQPKKPPGPQRPGGPPAQAPAAQPPHQPAPAPAAPAQRPAPPPPPVAAPSQPPRPPVSAPAQAPVAPTQRPVQQQPPAAAPSQPPRPPANAPAQVPPPAAPMQRPAQQQQQQAPGIAPGQPPRPPANAPAQVPPPAAPMQRPAQQQQQQQAPGIAPGQPPRPPANAPAQAPNAPLQHPAQPLPPAPAPGQPPRPPANAPALAPAPNAPPQRPAQTGPAPLPMPPAVAAPSAAQARPLRPIGPGATIAPTSAQGQPVLRVDGLRAERRQTEEGGRTIIREPDRVIVRENDGRFFIRHDEGERFRYNARDVRVERRGNDNVTIVMRPDGGRVVTVLDDNGRLVRRSRMMPDGREIIIIDDRGPYTGNYFVDLPPPVIRIPRERYIVDTEVATPALIFEALMAPPIERLERPYTLDEIRYSPAVRERMPRVDIDTINFEFGSWEIGPDQVNLLAGIADVISRAIAANPQEVFLIEGHTDAVGSDVDNLSLSDRRAESVALALTERFQIQPENLTTQGYGKQYLKIPTDGPERRNRRVTIRRITPLLAGGG